MYLRIFLIVNSLLSILIGGGIYLLYRSKKLIMFSWIKTLKLDNIVNKGRGIFCFIDTKSWVIMSLPDGLWSYSYINLMLLIWNRQITQHNLIWYLILPSIGILSEIGQYFNLISGTFDIVDLMLYVIGVILPFVLVNSLNFFLNDKSL